MDKNIIYLGAGDNLSEEDKRDRLYTIGFVVVIIIVFSILAIIVGGQFIQGGSSAPVVPSVTPTPIQAVKSAETNTGLSEVKASVSPEADISPTIKISPSSTPAPTAAPTSSPTNTPTPTPTPTNTPTPTFTPTPTATGSAQ